MSVVYLTEPGTHLHKEGGRFLICRGAETLRELPAEMLEGIVFFGGVQVSSFAIAELLRLGVPATWMSAKGRFYGRLDTTTHIQVLRQRQQFLLAEQEPVRLEFSRRIVGAKMHNQQTLLRRYNRTAQLELVEDGVAYLQALKEKVPQAAQAEELLGLEGSAARSYFACLARLVPEEFRFAGRNRRPPKDPFNSLLSFGYTLLLTELYNAVVQVGLHPYIGFLHCLRAGHPALVSDLMEEWRAVLIDSLALSLLSRRELVAGDFQPPDEEGGVYLDGPGRKKFLLAYEKRLRQENAYLGSGLSFRQTLLRQARQLAGAVDRQELGTYQPLRVR